MRRLRYSCGVFSILFAAVLISVVSFVLGVICAQLDTYGQRSQEERQAIEPILASDPAFREIRCSERSDGGVVLGGVVPAQEDWDRLRERIIRAVGEKRADKLIRMVGVRQ